MPSSQWLALFAQGLSVVTAVALVLIAAGALLFVYRAGRMLIQEKVRRGSVKVQAFGFRAEVEFGDAGAEAEGDAPQNAE